MKKIKFVLLMALVAIMFGFAGCDSDDLGKDLGNVDWKKAYYDLVLVLDYSDFSRPTDSFAHGYYTLTRTNHFLKAYGTETEMKKLITIRKKYINESNDRLLSISLSAYKSSVFIPYQVENSHDPKYIENADWSKFYYTFSDYEKTISAEFYKQVWTLKDIIYVLGDNSLGGSWNREYREQQKSKNN